MGIAAPQRQKSRRQQYRERPDEPGDSLRRSWRDVSKARLVFGLAVAPIVPVVLDRLTGLLWNNDIAMRDLIISTLWSIGFMMLWFIAAGSLFLFWLGHRIATIERFHCLALCATLSFFWPMVILLIQAAVAPPWFPMLSLASILAAAYGGLFFAPLGALGGWVLWRIAIHPAERPLQELTEVF